MSWLRNNTRRTRSTSQNNRRAALAVESLEDRFMPSVSAGVVPPAAPAVQVAAAQPDFNIFGGSGYNPAVIRHLYGFDQTSLDGTGQTIAIVDAFDEPNIVYDLQQFDKAFGLPAPPQFTEFKEHTTLGFHTASDNSPVWGNGPAYNSKWEVETALDVEWAHAIAPGANILLVETLDNRHLFDGVSFASAQAGVSVVSMSWGTDESVMGPGETGLDGIFTTPHVTYVAAAGDSGGERLYPAVCPTVLAVGGTSLYFTVTDTINYGSEVAWSGGGGGVSAFETEPAFQRPFQTYGQRTVPDVAYDADPGTGVAIYVHSQDGFLSTPWGKVGGTSVGAPQWAGLIALANQGRADHGWAPLGNAVQDLYSIPSGSFHDITEGYNGHWAHPGYDLATGLGTPQAPQIINALMQVEPPPPPVWHIGYWGLGGSTLTFALSSSIPLTNHVPVGGTTLSATGVTDEHALALGATVDSFPGLKPGLATLLGKVHAGAGSRLWNDVGFHLSDSFADLLEGCRPESWF